MSNRQLVPRKLSEQLAIQSERDRALVENTVTALWAYLDQPRTLLPGGESDVSTIFCRVGNSVLKVFSHSISGPFVYNVARNAVNCTRDRVTVSIAAASEGDLLDALEVAKGSARLRIQEFLRIVRQEPAEPLRIEVVNAEKIGTADKVLTVKRGDDGKMTAAVVQSLT